MPAERTIMRQVREVLRLKFVGGVPIREIARRIGVAASTVRATIRRFQAAGLSWPLPEEMTDAVLEAKLFADAGTKQGHRRQVEPDWASIHRELKRKHVTLAILWDEYVERNPEGYRYSRFCELYRSWEGKLSVTMRQTHVGGDKLFVDYAGDTVPVIIDRLTGEVRAVQIFVTTKREIVDGETRPLDLLAQRHPGTRAIEARVVDTGTILTGGGVSLGIDMTLHLIQRFFGREIAQETARILEYRNAWKANNAALPDVIEVRDAHHDRSSERSQAC
jgi:transposase-like protein